MRNRANCVKYYETEGVLSILLTPESILVNTTFMNLRDITLLCVTLWSLCRRSTTPAARKLKVSKTNGIKACWLPEHAFSCLTTLLDEGFKAVCHTVKGPTPKPTSGETPVKSTHACFPPTYPYTITFASLSADILFWGWVRKYTGTSFFSDTSARLNISKSTPNG